MKPPIVIEGDTLRIHFDSFGLEEYATFLRAKRLPEYRLEFHDHEDTYTVTAPARFASLLGVELPRVPRAGLPLADYLFDDQKAISRMSLDAKRFACWSDCGLGKTAIGLEFARHVCHGTGGRVLIVTLNEIVPQWADMARQFYGESLPVVRLESRAAMRLWCREGGSDASVAVVNYEKFNHRTEAEQVVPELRHLAGIILDESSRLKTGGGKQKWALIKSARGIEYKLSLTATPAPNEIMEFASQASFLEKLRDQNEIIWTYFRRDEKTHRWTVKPHALKAFFEFMAGWSIYVRDPRRYGWREGVPVPPEPAYFRHAIPITAEQRELVMDFNAKAPPPKGDRSGTPSMFAGGVNATSANKLSQAAKGFVYEKGVRSGGPLMLDKGVRLIDSRKPAFVADLIAGEAADGCGLGLQTLVWTVFDAEGQILFNRLKGAPFSVELLTGKTTERRRVEILERFRRGETRVLISRASMLGYGMNFQHCGSMVFSGWSFSYEQFYQAVRRAYRHGQTRSLRVHLPVVAELEGQMLEAIDRKDSQHELAIAEMEGQYIRALADIGVRKERAA